MGFRESLARAIISHLSELRRCRASRAPDVGIYAIAGRQRDVWDLRQTEPRSEQPGSPECLAENSERVARRHHGLRRIGDGSRERSQAGTGGGPSYVSMVVLTSLST